MSSLEEMSKEDLIAMISDRRDKKREYIKKYQQTEKGRKKTCCASKKYYDANREAILEKKRAYYQKKKAEKERAHAQNYALNRPHWWLPSACERQTMRKRP